MPLLRNNQTVEDTRLDRLVSVRTDHLEKYPLTTATLPHDETPVVAGVNWYPNFDDPVLRRISGREYYVIGEGNLGRVRGGHAVCLRPWHTTDLNGWWAYYDQGEEGRCAEFATLRMLTLLNRKRYDISSEWHYWEAQRNDEWPGGSYPGAVPQYEGTSVRAILDVVKKQGAKRTALTAPDPAEGIAAYRWATNWADVRAMLGVPSWLPGVPLLNSWGREGYPHQVLLLDDAGARLLAEDGEFGVVTDR